MSVVRASCPECGDVELTRQQVNVVEIKEDGSGEYGFPCHGDHVTKPAESRTIDLLLAAGCPSLALEIAGVEIDPVKFLGEPIDKEYLENFINQLGQTDYPQSELSADADIL